jgi:hypothetical protein
MRLRRPRRHDGRGRKSSTRAHLPGHQARVLGAHAIVSGPGPTSSRYGPGMVAEHLSWRICGTYLESCNCEVICPCRRVGGRAGGRSTYGVCEGALSWVVERGRAGEVKLDGLAAVLALRYDDDEPGSPWDFFLYVDERGDERQRAALQSILSGAWGGTALVQFPWAFKPSRQLGVRAVPIEVEHFARRSWFRAGDHVVVRVGDAVSEREPVTCMIPGHDRSGAEHHGELLRVADGPLQFELDGRCAYQSTFEYSSE